MSGRIALDLKQFKHVKSSKDSTTLRHNDGHELTVAHKPLSKEAREQLMALSKIPKDYAQKGDKSEAKADVDNRNMMADGGKVDGKKPKSATVHVPDSAAGIKQAKTLKDQGDAPHGATIVIPGSGEQPIGKVQRYAEGAYVEPEVPSALDPNAPSQQQAAPIGQFQIPQALQPTPEAMSAVPPEATAPPATEEALKEQAVSSQPAPSAVAEDALKGEGLSNKQQMEIDSGVATHDQVAQMPEQQAVAQQQAASQSEPGPSLAEQSKDANISSEDVAKKELSEEDAAWQHDLTNGHITPQTYGSLFAKKDTLGKIGMIFGMILSGIGSGISGQPNALMALLDQQIKNDLEAQKTSKSNAQNFLKINQAHFYNEAQIQKMVQEGKLTQEQANAMRVEGNAKAFALSNMQANRAALHSLTEKVAKMPMGSPQRKEGEQLLALMAQQVQSENYSIMDRAASSTALANYGFGATPEGAEKPSVDYAKITRLQRAGFMSPADASKANDEAAVVAETRALRNSYLNSFDELDKMALAGKLSPNQRKAEINALSAKLAQHTAHRFNLQEATSQAEGMFPQSSDMGKETRELKRRKGLELFDSMEAGTPTLNRFGLKNAPNDNAPKAVKPVERIDKATGKMGLFDPTTKKFLGYK